MNGDRSLGRRPPEGSFTATPCSLSTVKRHLRRARNPASSDPTAVADERRLPTMDEVFDAFEQVVDRDRARLG